LFVGAFVAADIWWCWFSSTIAMMHGPINIRLKHCFYLVSKYLVNEQNEDSYKVLLLHNTKKGERPTSYLQDTEVGSKEIGTVNTKVVSCSFVRFFKKMNYQLR
jgi:hypothetical protein